MGSVPEIKMDWLIECVCHMCNEVPTFLRTYCICTTVSCIRAGDVRSWMQTCCQASCRHCLMTARPRCSDAYHSQRRDKPAINPAALKNCVAITDHTVSSPLARVTAGLAESNGSLPAGFMTHVTRRLTAKNRDRLRNPTLGNRVWENFTFIHISIGSQPVVTVRKHVKITKTRL